MLFFWSFCSLCAVVLSLFFSPLAIMADAPVDVLLKGSSGRNIRGLLRIIILVTIAAAAVSSRLFSVIRMSPGELVSFSDEFEVQLSWLMVAWLTRV